MTIKKINNLYDLTALREQCGPALKERTAPMKDGEKRPVRHFILICTGGGCIASGALEVKAALRKRTDKGQT